MTGVIAVTGASGFIGRQTTALLRARGVDVRALSRSGRAGSIAVDPHDEAQWAAVLRGSSAVIHLAGLAHLPGRDPRAVSDAYRRANVDHALCVARAAASVGATLVLVSSAGVLGDRSPAGGFTDLSPESPYDYYTESKAEAERVLRRFADDSALPLVILRPPLVIGPEAPGNFGRLLRSVGRFPLPIGSLTARRSVIGVRNLASFLLGAATQAHCHGRTALLCEPAPMTMPEIVGIVAGSRGARYASFPVPKSVLRLGLLATGRGADAARFFNPFVLVPSVAPNEFGWRSEYAIEDEIRWAADRERPSV